MKTYDELWEDKKRTDQAYCRALDKADVEGLEFLEPLRIACEDANAALKRANDSLTGLPRRRRI